VPSAFARASRPAGARRSLVANDRFPNEGIFVGRLVALGRDGQASVAVGQQAGLERLTMARVLGAIAPSDAGRSVALMFERGRSDLPVVLGLIAESAPSLLPSSAPQGSTVEVDGQRIVLTGQQEVVLRCGEASITLSSDGAVVIRGTKLLSRSSGPNKIKGGSVAIN
jgi:hypothetical protein